MRIYIVFLLSICYCTSVHTQQEALYTQYMYNINIVNPGYMINTPDFIEVGSLYRTQWTGIEGAPRTANVFANIPINDNIELAVNYINDEIGDRVKQTENVMNLDMAYKIMLNETLNLSFGVRAGFEHISTNVFESNVADDLAFNNVNKTVLAIGTGAFLFSNNYYVGLSSPNLIPNELTANGDVVYQNSLSLFLIGGYIFDINNDIRLKPSSVVRQAKGAPISFDVALNALYKERFEFGMSYRYQDAITAMAAVEVVPYLRIGYAYDFNTSALRTFNNGSHEILITYRFDVVGLFGKTYSSPRFF